MRIRAFPKMEVLGRGPAAAEANACGNGGRPGKEQPGPDQLHGRGMRKANDDRAFFLCGETVGALPSQRAC